MSKLRHLSL